MTARRRGNAGREPAAPSYYLDTIEGLEGLAAEEVSTTLPAAEAKALGPGLVRVTGDLEPAALLRLKLPEDVFAVVLEREDFGGSRRELGAMRDGLMRGEGLRRALDLWRACRGRSLPRRVSYRVVARMQGQQGFRRAELGEALDEVMQAAGQGRWVPVEDQAHVELWGELAGRRCLIGLRLSDRTMRHRGYKVAHIPGSLRPTLAQAMARLTEPRPTDVFCDPMCGAGTILIERAEAGRYALLLGGDLDPRAVAAAVANVGRRYQPIRIERWDAAALPLDAASVSAMATNPPFGRKVGSAPEVPGLYRALAREAARVLARGSRLVLLADSAGLLEQAFRDLPFGRRNRLAVKILGHAALLEVVERL